MKKDLGTKSSASSKYKNSRVSLANELRQSSIPDNELTGNLGLYIERMHLSRILLMHELYKQIVNIPGNIVEFGVRWGQNIALFSAFRGMYEPYNYTRKVIGFDTFSGFPSVSKEDLPSNLQGKSTDVGDYNVVDGWKEKLEDILSVHESLSPLPHIKKWELIKGDATETFPQYLENHPELIVAFAYFDFDIYSPTKSCLEKLIDRLTKGSIVVFDELNCPEFPGETVALQQVIGTKNIALHRDPNNPYVSWFKQE
jgi:hypothetical protein